MGGNCRFAGAALLTKQGNCFHGVTLVFIGILAYWTIGILTSRAQIRQGALCGSIDRISVKLRFSVCSLPYSSWEAALRINQVLPIELNREKVIVLIGVIIRG